MKRVFAVWMIILGIISLLGVFSFLFVSFASLPGCNDGTAYNSCSGIKPYFCSEGILVEQASVCGCPVTFNVEGEKCSSNYQKDAKNISLNYVLRREQGEITFTVYRAMNDYLASLPRHTEYTENTTLFNFKVRSLEEKQQRELLLPLVIEIQNAAPSKEDQARIAVSIVQNIPFGKSNKTVRFGQFVLDYQRYPYEVLYEMQGVCGEKSELLVFILKELGFNSSFFYYPAENHEAVGIECPVRKSFNKTGYCFVETTGPAIISDYETEYVIFGKLFSVPEITPFESNFSFEKNFYEFRDARALARIRDRIKTSGTVNFFQHLKFQSLKGKYGLLTFNATYTF
jgi:hypothetical protein